MKLVSVKLPDEVAEWVGKQGKASTVIRGILEGVMEGGGAKRTLAVAQGQESTGTRPGMPGQRRPTSSVPDVGTKAKLCSKHKALDCGRCKDGG